MRENRIAVPKRRKRKPVTTGSRHALPVAPNLLDREFERTVPDTVWLADITYLATGEGWLYLAAIKDLATREIAGWALGFLLKALPSAIGSKAFCPLMDGHLRPELCERALIMAIQRRHSPIDYLTPAQAFTQMAREA